MSSGEAKNSSADRQLSSKSKNTRHVAAAGHQRRRAPSASSAPRPSPVGGARASRQQNDRAPRGKRGGMQRMSDEADMMLVEATREMQEGQGHGGSSSSTLPVSSRGAAATPTRLDLGGKRPRCSLDGGGGSGNDTKVSVSLSVNPAKKKKKKKREKREKTRTPTGAGSSTSSSPPPASAAAPRPRPDRAATAGTAGAAAAGGTGAPSSVHPAGAARRGVRGAGDGVEVVRHVSVEERIAENQRRRGVIDIRDGGGVAPRVVPLAAGARSAPPGGAARAAARRGGGGGGSGGGSGSGGARRGGGVPCNLAVAEGWTQAAPSSVPLPAKLEASAAQGTSNNASARLPAPATPVATSAAPAPAATPPPANGGGGGGGGGGGEVSVSDIFRERGVKFHIKLAATVGLRAKKMYVQECGKVAGKLLRKRPALDRYMNEMPAPWDWGRSVPENVYPASYRGMLHEAFDSVFGVVAP